MSENLLSYLGRLLFELEEQKLSFSLSGGLVANLYRETPRMTRDIDVALLGPPAIKEAAHRILESFNLKPFDITLAELQGGPQFAIKAKSTPVQIVVGQTRDKDAFHGIDFILPTMPWVEEAVGRAQSNCLDVGIGKTVPCLTREDLIISKLHSFRDSKTRYKDLDDLKEILRLRPDLDVDLLGRKVQ